MPARMPRQGGERCLGGRGEMKNSTYRAPLPGAFEHFIGIRLKSSALRTHSAIPAYTQKCVELLVVVQVARVFRRQFHAVLSG